MPPGKAGQIAEWEPGRGTPLIPLAESRFRAYISANLSSLT
jgi:hypothetical protein